MTNIENVFEQGGKAVKHSLVDSTLDILEFNGRNKNMKLKVRYCLFKRLILSVLHEKLVVIRRLLSELVALAQSEWVDIP